MRKNLKAISKIIENTKTDIENAIGIEQISGYQIEIMRNMGNILENLTIEVKNIKDAMEKITLNSEETGERLDVAEMVLIDIIDCLSDEDDDEDDEEDEEE